MAAVRNPEKRDLWSLDSVNPSSAHLYSNTVFELIFYMDYNYYGIRYTFKIILM